jgi:hypothetical protein
MIKGDTVSVKTLATIAARQAGIVIPNQREE